MKRTEKIIRRKSKVEQFKQRFGIIRFVVAVVIALAISLLIMGFTSATPFQAIRDLFIGPLTTVRRFSTVIEMAIPLTFTGLGICIMFKANQFNLAVEGGFFMGALMAAIIAINMPGPSLIVIIAAMVVAGLVGGFICAIPGFLKVKWQASELVVSLMLNYVMLYLGTFIFNQTIKDPDSAYHASFLFQEHVNLGRIIPRSRLHYGLFIMLAFVAIIYFLVYKTKWGYKLRVIGSNLKFGEYAGIGSAGIIMSSQLVGGFIGGVGGATEMIGMYTRFQWSTLPGFGFDGVVLNILARRNPAFIPIAAFAVSYIRIGADYMYRQSDVAAEIVAIIEALVIVLVAAEAFLSHYEHKQITKLSKEETKKTEVLHG